MPRRRCGPRVLGPYPLRGGPQHVLITFEPDGSRTTASYPTKEAAEADIPGIRERLRCDVLAVEDAVAKYRAALKTARRRPRTIQVYASAVLSLLPATRLLRDVSAAYLQRRVDERLAEMRKTRAKAPERRKAEPRAVSVDTIATELRATRTFLRWCAGKGRLLGQVPPKLDAVRVDGTRQAGKAQLTADEARAYLDAIAPAANKGDEGAVCAAALLILGVRSRELLDRQVRDLDQGGTVLIIQRGKTRRSRRKVKVPAQLRGWLLARARGRVGQALLFGQLDPETSRWVPRSSSWMAKQVRKWCGAAKVPVVCPHGLRGTHGSLAEEAGATPELVAAALGHAGIRTAARAYTLPESRQAGRQQRALHVLAGGRDPEESVERNGANPSTPDSDQQEP